VISVANTSEKSLPNRVIQINIGVKLFANTVSHFDVMSRPKEYIISDNTELKFGSESLTAQEKQWLESAGILRVRSYSSSGDVNEVHIDFGLLARMAFEYDLLQSVASRVEIDILEVFRGSNENTLTTSEIAEETGRPKSSISRALSRLVEKNKLIKVQAGVYRYSS